MRGSFGGAGELQRAASRLLSLLWLLRLLRVRWFGVHTEVGQDAHDAREAVHLLEPTIRPPSGNAAAAVPSHYLRSVAVSETRLRLPQYLTNVQELEGLHFETELAVDKQ